MKCPHCNCEVTKDDRFCGECGADLASVSPNNKVVEDAVCATCGAVIVFTDSFCKDCGKAVFVPSEASAAQVLAPDGKSPLLPICLTAIATFSVSAITTALEAESTHSWLGYLAGTSSGIGILLGVYLRKKKNIIYQRAFYHFSIFFSAALLGFLCGEFVYFISNDNFGFILYEFSDYLQYSLLPIAAAATWIGLLLTVIPRSGTRHKLK